MNHFRTSIKVLLLLTIVSSVVFTIRTSITTPTETNTAQNLEDVFSLAKKESLGFFDDVASAHWKLLKKKVSDMSPNYNPRYLPYSKDRKIVLTRFEKQHKVGHFYQNHYEPDFICQHERRIGTLGDGGKWICDPHRISKQDSCLVYSIGSNNDFSFEEAVLKDIGSHCEIHTFDFDDFSEGAKKAGVHYHQVGLGIDDPPKFKSLSTIIKDLGHEGRMIDIFKIDCEGCEWDTAHEWFKANVTLRQIQVELHRYNDVKTPKFFDLIYENNYVITHKELNMIWGEGIEYALLKLDSSFSEGIVRAKGAPEDIN